MTQNNINYQQHNINQSAEVIYWLTHSLGVIDKLRIEIIGNLPDKGDGQSDDLFCVEGWEGSEDFVGTVSKLVRQGLQDGL
jgi:hypothetical protein